MLQKILGEDWKEEAKRYIARLEEEKDEKTAQEKPRTKEGGEE